MGKSSPGRPLWKTLPIGGDLITHDDANYRSIDTVAFDVSSTRGLHPDFGGGTASVGTLPANGFGITEIAANLYEWVWDWSDIPDENYYPVSAFLDPRGPETGFRHINRSSSYATTSIDGPRNAYYQAEYGAGTAETEQFLGFRIALNVEDTTAPVSCEIDWSTYLGGGGTDVGHGVAFNENGDVYVTGETSGSGFPFTQGTGYNGGTRDAFLSAFYPDGSLWFSQFHGTGGNDVSLDIALDGAENVLIAGVEGSAAFVTKFDSLGTEIWTKPQSGSSADSATGVDVDGNDHIYVVGSTSSSDFPVQPDPSHSGDLSAVAYNGGDEDLFITKRDTDGTIIWSRFLGGSGQDGTTAGAITLDSNDDFYVGGVTFSSVDFPVSGPGALSFGGGRDSFVVKLDATGLIVWGTFLGGSGSEAGSDLVTDSDDNVYAGGRTSSSDFPTQNANGSTYNGGASDTYVTRFDEDGDLVWSRFIGGSGEDSLQGLTIQQGEVIIASGYTRSSNFPVVNGSPKGPGSNRAAFITHLNTDGDIIFSTVIDGSSEEEGIAVTTDMTGSVALTGFSTSGDFPIHGADPFDDSHNGQHDVFVVKFDCDFGLNESPVCVFDAPDPAECDGPTTSIALDGSESFDPEDGLLAYLWESDCPNAQFDDPNGESPLLTLDTSDGCGLQCSASLIVTDDQGAESNCTVPISVEDTVDPSLVVPSPLELECDQSGGLPASDPRIQDWLASALASDRCSTATVVNDAADFFSSKCSTQVGTQVNFTATDQCDNQTIAASTVSIVDTTPPIIECQARDILPTEAPISFTATALDTCSIPNVQISGYECFAINKAGKKVDKSGSCVVSINGSTITISDAGGVGNMIKWMVVATDACGNTSTQECQITVLNPGQGQGNDNGNEGVGNGVDPDTPGHDNNGGNDDPGNGPGNPGAKKK